MGDLANLMKLVRMQEEGPHPCRTCRHYISGRCQHKPTLNGHGNLCDNCTFWEKEVNNDIVKRY